MDANHPAALAPIAERWSIFIGKVRARIAEVLAEADGAYREVIAIDVIDGTALSGVSSALTARLHGLRAKVSEAWEKIDKEIDRAGDALEGRAVGRFRGDLLRVRVAFERELEQTGEEHIVRREADAARALQRAAEAEAGVRVPCRQCGAMLERPVSHVAVNITCAHCRAVTTATPGTAAAIFIQGMGSIALAREAALPAWHALQTAEAAWRRLRHRTEEDLARFEEATRAYWTAMAEERARWMPGWTAKDVADDVLGKMGHFNHYTAKNDVEDRAAMSRGLALAASGDAAQVVAWAHTRRDAGSAAESLLEACVERGWMDLAWWLAQVVHPLVEPHEPRDAWARGKLDEIAYYAATRGD